MPTRIKSLLAALIGLIVLLALGYFQFKPQPLEKYVPADCLGYFEVEDLSRLAGLMHEKIFIEQAVGRASSTAVQRWLDAALKPLGLSSQRLKNIQLGLILTSASAGSGQTLTLHGVVIIRYHSILVRRLKFAPRTVAEAMADSQSFVAVDSLHGHEVAVLTRSPSDHKMFVAVARDAVLVSNQREALAAVLATMEGTGPPISATAVWKSTPAQSPENSNIRGYFAGAAILNLLRDFLVTNYSPFDDAARTTRFLAALGLDQVQTITYHAHAQSGSVDEIWQYYVPPGANYSKTFLSVFTAQRGRATADFEASSIPPNTVSARFLSLSNSQEMWNSITSGVGILTNQEAPQNRDLLIAMFEGALGFRVGRDLLANLSDSMAIFEIAAASEKSFKKQPAREPESNEGMIFVLKAKDPAKLEAVFSKIISEDRPPASVTVGSAKIFFAGLHQKSANPLIGFVGDMPAFAVIKDLLYFSPQKELLIAAFQALQQTHPASLPRLPPSFDLQAPYLSYSIERASDTSPSAATPAQPFSFSELKADAEGFQYHRTSSCGFICELIRQAMEVDQ